MLSIIYSEFEPFLTKYQTDWPMVPFMRNDIYYDKRRDGKSLYYTKSKV